MSLPIRQIEIKNFKSIKETHLEQCKRVNLFIGKPNVGKSNLLEALSLFSFPFLKYLKRKDIRQFIRVENVSELFHDGDISQPIHIKADPYSASVTWLPQNTLSVDLRFPEEEEWTQSFATNLSLVKKNIPDVDQNPFRSYYFPSTFGTETNLLSYLLPPSGGNLMNTVSRLPSLVDELKNLFAQYGLRPVFDMGSMEIKAIREKENGEIFLVPFSGLADTLRRVIFYKAAIQSNRNSVLLFEEPEAHAYPPYITGMIQDIIHSTDNQFFLTTHSPYVVNALLENPANDLSIYVVDMKAGCTVVKRLTDAELQEAYEYGVDLFFNIETFQR